MIVLTPCRRFHSVFRCRRKASTSSLLYPARLSGDSVLEVDGLEAAEIGDVNDLVDWA